MLLKTRIIVGVSLAMLLLSAGLWIAGNFVDQRLQNQFLAEKTKSENVLLKRILLAQKQQMTAQMRGIMRDREALSAITHGIAEDVEEAVIPTFNRLTASKIIDGLYVMDLNGSILLHAPEKLDPSSVKALLDFAVKNRIAAYGATLDTKGALSVVLAFPLFKSGKLIGAAAYLRDFKAIAEEFKNSDQTEILITGSQGKQLISTNAELFGNFKPSQFKHAAEARRNLEYRGSYFEVVALPVEDASGRQIAQFFTVSDVTSSYLENRQISLLIKGGLVSFVIIFLCAMAFWLRRQFTPLTQTISVLENLSMGNYNILCEENNRKDEIGTLSRTVSVFRENLVQSVEAEAMNQRLARIVEDAINEIFVFDADSLKFLQVNRSACNNLGYTMEELRELTPVDLKPEFTREEFVNQIAPLRAGEKAYLQFETVHRRKDGSLYDVKITLQKINSPNQNVFAAIIEDITVRKLAEEKLQNSLAKEKKLNKLQREFVSMASHEFRTPLTIIDGVAQRIKSRADKNRLTPEDAIERVEKIRDAVRRMTRLMDSTLAAARMQDGKIVIDIHPCDISSLVQEVCEHQQEISGNHVISCDLADLPATIQADSGCVEQMLSNLLSNAVKYAPDAPGIEVRGCMKDDQVVISVRDYGFGIDADELGRVGERFFRAKTSTGTAGTGIGLNLVKTLVEMHGGSIRVESKKGEGSTFTISLPVAGPDLSEQPEQVETKVA